VANRIAGLEHRKKPEGDVVFHTLSSAINDKTGPAPKTDEPHPTANMPPPPIPMGGWETLVGKILKHMSKMELAAAVGTSPKAVHYWLTGKWMPPKERAYALLALHDKHKGSK